MAAPEPELEEEVDPTGRNGLGHIHSGTRSKKSPEMTECYYFISPVFARTPPRPDAHRRASLDP